MKLTGFAPKKGQTYRVAASVNDVNGNVVAQSVTLTNG